MNANILSLNIIAGRHSDVHCEDLQMERTKCMTSESCPDATPRLEARRCQYSEWTEWMPCSVSCGVGITFRKRFLARMSLHLNFNYVRAGCFRGVKKL